MRTLLAAALAVLGLATADHARAADAAAACMAIAGRMLDQLAHGAYAAATADFDEQMKAAAPPDKLADGTQTMIQRYGQPGRHDLQLAKLRQVPGFLIVDTPQLFGNTAVTARVVCDAQGKVSGFWWRP